MALLFADALRSTRVPKSHDAVNRRAVARRMESKEKRFAVSVRICGGGVIKIRVT